MSRFNSKDMRTQPAVMQASSPLKSEDAPTLRTALNAPAWARDARTELYLLTAGGFLDGRDKFHETAKEQDKRAVELVRMLAVQDPEWTFRFLRWLRADGNMRTAPIMLAVEFVKARLQAEREGKISNPMPVGEYAQEVLHWNRRVIDAVCQRADEPGEIIAYHLVKYGKRIPMPIKYGVADAAKRLYNERSLLKYDTASHAMRFADVLELCHPSPDPDKAWQGDLFKHAIDRRHGRDGAIPEVLTMLRARHRLNRMDMDERHAFAISARDEQSFGDMTLDGVQSLMKLGMANQWEWFVSWLGTSTE